MIDLSVVIVNHNSANYAVPCARSVLESLDGSGAIDSVELVVVDNDSEPLDRERLDGLPARARVVETGSNLGYGGGANVGFRKSRGRLLCLLNPDLLVLPGAIDRMARHALDNPGVGAVGPRTFLDEERTVQHPLNRRKRLKDLLRAVFALRSPQRARAESLRSTRFALPFWRAREPRTIAMLSGACLVIPRRTLEKVGGFDPRFHLYFEDDDWCRRVGRAGLDLVYLPNAEIVHFFNMSVRKLDREKAMREHARSERKYFGRSFGPIGAAAGVLLSRAFRRSVGRLATSPPWPIEDLGRPESPPTFQSPAGEGPFLVEIAGTPFFEYSASAIPERPAFRLPDGLFGRLAPGTYFVRILGLESLDVRRVWRFEK